MLLGLKQRMRISAGILPAGLMFLAGCAVGPDYDQPAAPDVKNYTAGPAATTLTAVPVAGTAGGAQALHYGGRTSERLVEVIPIGPA